MPVFLNQIQSAAGLSLFTANSSGNPEYFAANTANRVIAVNASASGFELKSYANWDTAFSWGNHASAGYLTTETDPIFSSSPASGITGTNITNWNTAYSWGNHATVGYITAPVAASLYVPYTGATQNVDLGERGIAGGFFSFDTTPTTYTPAVGRVAWNDTNGTLEMLLKGGNVLHTVGETTFARVYNNTGSSISRGQIVYISGSSGTRLTIDLADADTEATSKNTLGFAAETIGINSEGFVMISGLISNVNTSGYADGATMFLSSTAGGYTNVAPTHPAHTVILGFVVKGNSTGGGSIFVKVNNGYEIDELHNVLISSVQPNDVLYYDSVTQLWKNASIVSKIANNSLSLAQLPQIATSSFLGRVSAGTGNVEVLTATQATSILNTFSTTSTTKGLVPGSNNLGNTYFLRADGTWAVPAGGGGGSGTVTSVDLAMPTGFTVSNNPVTTSGTLTVAFASGYSLPTNTSQANWDSAYSWGNHASAGYLTSIANNSIGNAQLRQSNGYSVIGRSAATLGDVADITAANDFEILRRSGGTLGFGAIDLSQTGAVGTSRLDFNNIKQGAGLSVLGVAGSAAASVADITAGSDFQVLRRSGTSIGFGTLNAAAMNAAYTASQVLTTDALGNLSWTTVSGGGGLTFFTESRDTATPNATVPAHTLAATGVEANIDLVLQPKGTGAFILDVPNNAASGGNKRGIYAVDLQIDRTAANQVASGANSGILSGQNNRNGSANSVIAGGTANIINSGQDNFIGGGNTNSINSAGGSNNNQSAILVGQSNSNNGSRSVILGGLGNRTDADYSAVINGAYGMAGLYNQVAASPFRFASGDVGGVQRSDISAWRAVVGTAASNLFLNGSSARITLITANTGLSNKLYGFRIMLAAVCTVSGGSINANDVFGRTFEGVIKRVGTTTTLVGSVNTVNTWSDGGFTANTPTIAITADDTNEALDIQWTTVGGNASTTVRVNATIHLTEIGW